MPKFANQSKGEVSRPAKKKVKDRTRSLKKAFAAFPSEMACIERLLTELDVLLKKMNKETSRSKAVERSEDNSGVRLRFRAAGFATLRKKLGISAAEMGKLLEVSAQSVYNWETGKTKPRASQLEAISTVRKMGKRGVTAKLNELSDQ